MAMSPQAFRYKWLWKRLKQKFFPKPSVFVVHGRYRVQHESGYDWVIGYCDYETVAEEMAESLREELRRARSKLGPFHGASRTAYRKLDAFYNIPYEEREKNSEYVRLYAAYRQADNALRDAIDEVMKTMTDQDIPFPYSHLIDRYKGHDGPIEYYIEEITRCRRI